MTRISDSWSITNDRLDPMSYDYMMQSEHVPSNVHSAHGHSAHRHSGHRSTIDWKSWSKQTRRYGVNFWLSKQFNHLRASIISKVIGNLPDLLVFTRNYSLATSAEAFPCFGMPVSMRRAVVVAHLTVCSLAAPPAACRFRDDPGSIQVRFKIDREWLKCRSNLDFN